MWAAALLLSILATGIVWWVWENGRRRRNRFFTDALRLAESPGHRFEASDVDERYVSKLQETGFSAPVRVESVCELQRQQDEFDYVILLEVLEHIEDYRRALSELFRVARRGVIVSVPNEPLWRALNCLRLRYLGDLGNTPGHLNHWSPRRFARLVGEYGTVQEIYRPLPWIMLRADVVRR